MNKGYYVFFSVTLLMLPLINKSSTKMLSVIPPSDGRHVVMSNLSSKTGMENILYYKLKKSK